MRRLLFVAASVLVLALPASSFAATTTIKITPAAFSPKYVTVAFGDTVTWVNTDTATHQIVADNGAFASATLKQHETYSFTFKAAGRYPYHDALHPKLKGAVTVKGPPPSVTLGAGVPILVYGSVATLTGTVSNGQANEPVMISGQPYGSVAVQQLATVMTGTGGGFAYAVQPSILTTYTARWKTASSQTVSVQVRPKLTLLPFQGRFFAKVLSPVSYAGKYIYLQRLSAFGQWITVAKLTLGPLSGRIFSMPRLHGRITYHVYMSQDTAGPGYLDGWSGTQRVRRK